MFTVDSLMRIAAEAETRFNAATTNRYNDAREMELAMIAAEWLEKRGGTARYVGSFGKIDIRKGDRVRIKVGAKISSTSKRLVRTLTRAYTVTVHSINEGYISTDSREGVRNPSICWVGAGGYWCYTDLENAEKV